MCQFEYKNFRSCGHIGIEVHDFCNEALWKAGRRGELQICIPQIFTRSPQWLGEEDQEPPQRTVFVGYEGHCNMCITAYQLPRSIPEKNGSDLVLDYTKPYNVFDPDETGPYLLTRGFFARIPDLLGVYNQIELAEKSHGPYISFPPIVEQTSWSDLRKSMPFTSKGVFEQNYIAQNNIAQDNALTMRRLALELDIIAGITVMDKMCIHTALRTGFDLGALYTMMFKPRGMQCNAFDSIIRFNIRSVFRVVAAKAAARPDPPQVLPAISDISTLTDLTNTPELSSPGISVQASPLPPQFPQSAEHDSAKEEQMMGTLRNGYQAKATRLARTAIEACSRGERELSEKKAMPVTSAPSAMSAMKDVLARQNASVDGLNVGMSAEAGPSYYPRGHGSVEAIIRRTSSLKSSEDKQNIPPPVVEAGQHHITSAQQGKGQGRPTPLPRRKPAFEVSETGSPIVAHCGAGPSIPAQLMMGLSSLDAGEQGPGGKETGSPTTHDATSCKTIDTFTGVGAHGVGNSIAGEPISQAPLPFMDNSFPRKEEVFRFLGNLTIKGTQGRLPQDPHKKMQEVRQGVQDILNRPAVSEHPRAPQEKFHTNSQQRRDGLLSLQRSDGRGAGGELPAVFNQSVQPSETGIQQPRAVQSSLRTQQAHGIPQQHRMHYQASAATIQQPHAGQSFPGAQQTLGVPQQYGMYQQVFNLPSAFAPQHHHHALEKHRRILTLSDEDVRAWVESNGAHAYSASSAVPAQPAFLIPGGLQQLAQGLPQGFQTSTQFSQPAFPTAIGSQRLANGLPQLPQGPAQGLQSAQHPQGFRSRYGPQSHHNQSLASFNEVRRIPGPLLDEDSDLQESSREAWSTSLATRKRKFS